MSIEVSGVRPAGISAELRIALEEYRGFRHIVKEMSRTKMERRRQLARLPIEEKIPILLRLQRIAVEISQAGGRKRYQVWKQF